MILTKCCSNLAHNTPREANGSYCIPVSTLRGDTLLPSSKIQLRQQCLATLPFPCSSLPPSQPLSILPLVSPSFSTSLRGVTGLG